MARQILASICFAVTIAAFAVACSPQTTGGNAASIPPPPAQQQQTTSTAASTTTGTWTHTEWWESGLAAVVILDRDGRAICNGAMVSQKFAVALASCHGAALIHFRYDHDASPVAAQRTEVGLISIYALNHDQDQVWPHALPLTAPAANEEVRAIAFPYPDMTKVTPSAQACHVQAGHTDCARPNALAGAPIFNWNGDLIGLIGEDGAVVSAQQMSAILRMHGAIN